MNKKIDFIKKEWPIMLLILLSFILGIYFYPSLPDKVPSHWNINGQIDGYSSRFFGAFGIPMMNIGLYVLLLAAPLIDPKKRNYDYFSSTYRFIRYLTHILFIGIQALTLVAAFGIMVNTTIAIQIGISLFFALLGNVMGRFKHNYFVGIKTPWTLASEEVWKKTHRMAAPIWVAGGILGVLTAFIGGSAGFKIFFVAIMAMALIPVVYSYIAYRNITKNI